MSAASGCSPSYHEALRTVWREVKPIGMQELPGHRPLELGNCLKCHSTLVRHRAATIRPGAK